MFSFFLCLLPKKKQQKFYFIFFTKLPFFVFNFQNKYTKGVLPFFFPFGKYFLPFGKQKTKFFAAFLKQETLFLAVFCSFSLFCFHQKNKIKKSFEPLSKEYLRLGRVFSIPPKRLFCRWGKGWMRKKRTHKKESTQMVVLQTRRLHAKKKEWKFACKK